VATLAGFASGMPRRRQFSRVATNTNLFLMRILNASLSVLLAYQLTTPLARAQDWPEFRGGAGDGLSSLKDLPTKWSESENIAWKTPIPGKGWSSPIFVAGKVYLTTAVVTNGEEDSAKADRSLRALRLDAATGKIEWDVEVFAQVGSKAPNTIHQKNSHASPTPIWHDGRLYVHFGHQGTACLDAATGKTLWQNRELFYEPRHGNGCTPILVDGRLIFSCDGTVEQFVAALNANDGSLAWKFIRQTNAKSKFAFATAACFTINGKKQVISPGADVVNALDPATGMEIWRVAYEGYSIVPKPLYGNGLVYVCTSFDTPDVLAIKPDGTGDVTETHVAWQVDQSKRTPKTCSMILDGDLLYWVSDNGLLSCVDAKTGDTIWMERIGSEYTASPILADGKLYLTDEHGKTSIVSTGREFKLLGENRLEDSGKTYASLAVSAGTLFLRGEKALYCIREKK
jgi:outer membrane protein assembly factor BamB